MKKEIHKIRPIGTNIFVKREESVSESSGGIIIPDCAQEKSRRGVIIAVGLEVGVRENSPVIPLQLFPKDTVLFTAYGGHEVKIDGEEYLLIQESDILAVIE